MEIERTKIGIFGAIFPGFKLLLEHGNFEPVDISLEKVEQNKSQYSSLDAIIIDLNHEKARKLLTLIKDKDDDLPVVLIADEMGNEAFYIEFEPFAVVHRPFTPFELIDVIRWTCEIKRIDNIERNEHDNSDINQRIRKPVDVILKESAQELLRNTQWLAAIVDHLPLGLVLLSPDKKVVRANEKLKRLFGISGNIVGKAFEEVVPWFEKEKGILKIDECLKGNNVIREIYQLRKSGYLEVIYVPVVIEYDTHGVLIIAKDITVEARSTRRLEAIVSIIDEGIIIVDRNRHLVWVNHVVRQWFGVDNDYEGKYCYQTLYGNDVFCQGCALEQVFESGVIHHIIREGQLANGERRTFEIFSGPIHNPDGEVVQIIEIIRDVTQREKIIKDLANTKNRLEDLNSELSRRVEELNMLMQLADELQFGKDLDNTLRIFLTAVTAKQGCGFNRAFLFIVDREKEKLIGRYALGPSSIEEAGRIWAELDAKPLDFPNTLKSYRQVIGETDIEVNRIIRDMDYSLEKNSDELIVKVLNSGEPLIVNDANQYPGAKDLADKLNCSEFAIVPLIAAQNPVGILIVDNMVTGVHISESSLNLLKAVISHASVAIERSILTDRLNEQYHELEDAYQKLRENQELLVKTERLSAIGKLAAQMAHEIRNPLVSIGGFSKKISQLSNEDEDIKDFAQIINEESVRLERIIDDILSYSRIANPNLAKTNIRELVGRTIDLINDEFEEHGIEIIKKLELELFPIDIDADQIRQVLLNLFRNSQNAMENGGELTVELEKEGSFIMIKVSDTGGGIPESNQGKIFEPFFTTKSSGTGLGLSISSQIIEAHNGMIWYNNNDEGGVTFNIKLPTGEKDFRG